MSGDTPRDQEQEFEDFILEDAPVDDLESLFEEPKSAAAKGQPAEAATPGEAAPPDESDLLFEHSEIDETSEQFGQKVEFQEEHGPLWKGHRMTPSEIGIPVDEPTAAAAESAAAAFAEELDNLLEGDEEFTVDGDAELELVENDSQLVDGGEVDGEAFVVDDGEAAAAAAETDDVDDFAAAPEFDADAAFAEHLGAPAEEITLEDAESTDFGLETEADAPAPYDEAEAVGDFVGEEGAEAVFEDEPVDEAWAPVEADYSDVTGEEAPADDGGFVEEGELVGVGADSEDQQNYLDSTNNRFVGAPERGRRGMRMFTSLAAALLVLGAGGAVVMRPEWFGLRFQPDLVQRVEIARPSIDLHIEAPTLPVVAITDPVVTPPTDPAVTPPSDPVAVQPTDPVVTPPSDPVAVQPTDPVVTPPADPVTQPPSDPVAVQPTDPAVTPPADPVAIADPVIQVSETLAIGGFEPAPENPVDTTPAIASVMPGTRAFAQLRNGNFFIGNVKVATKDSVVLRMDAGELTLPMHELQRLMGLGSEDYGDLQRATSGYIKLTNSSRFVGTILKTIADDHVILEMKSDRVMLPRSEIEEIGDTNREVMVGGNREEDQWLQKLVEQQMQDTAGKPEPGLKTDPDAIVIPAPKKPEPPKAPAKGAGKAR